MKIKEFLKKLICILLVIVYVANQSSIEVAAETTWGNKNIQNNALCKSTATCIYANDVNISAAKKNYIRRYNRT